MDSICPPAARFRLPDRRLNFVGLRPYSSPNCNPLTGGPGNGCPADGVPVFTNIFAEDTIAASAYNSFQASLEKRFSHGLQLQAAYTFSKSLDWASSFEETVNPFDYKASRALSLFNSAQRFVINYYWDLPVPKIQRTSKAKFWMTGPCRELSSSRAASPSAFRPRTITN